MLKYIRSINLPNSTCKIAHQSQLINIIGNHSNTVNYTIVSSIPDTNRCKLFLTATPFLNKIYDAFYVELLPVQLDLPYKMGYAIVILFSQQLSTNVTLTILLLAGQLTLG